jgi:outer membrane biosynthesis protein TonB
MTEAEIKKIESTLLSSMEANTKKNNALAEATMKEAAAVKLPALPKEPELPELPTVKEPELVKTDTKKSTEDLGKMKEKELVDYALSLGLNVTIKDKKQDTIDKILALKEGK